MVGEAAGDELVDLEVAFGGQWGSILGLGRLAARWFPCGSSWPWVDVRGSTPTVLRHARLVVTTPGCSLPSSVVIFLDVFVELHVDLFLLLACFDRRSGWDTRDSVARFGEQHCDGVMSGRYPLELLVMKD